MSPPSKPPPSRPRAFISYRHIEYAEGADADALNLAHRQWIEKFALNLDRFGVEAVYDEHLRQLFAPYTRKDPYHVSFLAELSTISCLVCHAFLPILTPAYLDSVGYANYRRQDQARAGFAFEEFQMGLFYANGGAMQYIPIICAGEPERMATLPIGVAPDTAFDMRDPKDYPFQMSFIAQRIVNAWDGGHPLIALSLGEWMQYYVDWCRRNDPRCASQRVDEWTVDLLRPRLFLSQTLNR